MNRLRFGLARLLAVCLGVALPLVLVAPAWAQNQGADIPSNYLPEEGLTGVNEYLIGPGGEMQPQQQQEPIINVKIGTKIFDAVEPHSLLYYKVNIVPIRVSQYDPAKYSDDGINNGDEVPNDGMPSQIEIENSRYISIYSARNRDRMKTMKQRMVEEGPVKFFRLGAVTPDAHFAAASFAAPPEERLEREKFTITYWKDRIGSQVDAIDDELVRYEGLEVFMARDDMGTIITDQDGLPYFDTTRPPEEVFDILDGREKQRMEALDQRDLEREKLQAARDQKYEGNVPSMNYIRSALGAQQAAELRTQRMNEVDQNRVNQPRERQSRVGTRRGNADAYSRGM